MKMILTIGTIIFGVLGMMLKTLVKRYEELEI